MQDEAQSPPQGNHQHDTIAFAFARGLGPWLTALRGKIPVYDAWPTLGPVTEDQVREWIEIGYNAGFRTGTRSGYVVIDDDQERCGIPVEKRWIPPPTKLIAESPTGGRHYYYRAPAPCPGNSASRIAPHVDVRGENGQVVAPPSVHPTALRPYRWVEQGDAGEFPLEVLALLVDRPRGTVHVDTTTPLPSGNGYAHSALVREAARVRAAPEGTRNEQLNKSAYNLGQLVGGGALLESDVIAELTSAAQIAGLETKETEKTIRSGLTAGAREPRTAPLPSVPRGTSTIAPSAAATSTDDDALPEVLVPGSHVLPTGEYQEQGNDTFAESVLREMPPGSLYRRAQIVGEIHDGTFRSVSPDRVRALVDANVRLAAGKVPKDGGDPVSMYRPCSRDHAGLILAAGETSTDLRELRHIATYPVCYGPEFKQATAGWNDEAGLYLTYPKPVDPLSLDTARAVLEDLVCDFPFASPADRANYFGLLLTPILRPAIPEPVPMHLIGSPVERSGKTKLAQIVLGCSILGRPLADTQLGVREEEHEKRLFSALIGGESILHLDNLREYLDSPSLASLLTSAVYQGRELGHSRLVKIPNDVTIVATGNNVHTSGEIAKRIVPVMLQPDTESPQTRQDYRHPQLRAYVESVRPRVLGALLGLVEAWRDAGRPQGGVGFGGFERWSATLGGIMRVAGYPEWLSNINTWRGEANDFGADLRELVGAWNRMHGSAWVEVSTLFAVATELGVFERELNQATDRGQRTAFGQRVVSAIANRVVGSWKIEVVGVGRHRRARLGPVAKDNLDNLGTT